jgi:NAD(P)-dependent dehydrogenase (short-subunit alcohol dehydrogenase family)
MRFKDKVALITGGGQGIGKAVAVELAKGGAALALNDIDAGRLEGAAVELRQYGTKVTVHPGSVVDAAFIQRMADDAVAQHGKVDLLLNNAGGGMPGVPWKEFAESDLEDFRKIFEMNFFSQVMVLRALLPGMLARGYGRVVCVSSISAAFGQEAGSAYASGKIALHALVSSVSKEVARRGVNINAVMLGNPPHWTRTPARQAFLDRLSHFNRIGRLEEFGTAITFLLSDDASYMSGMTIPIDGGMLVPRLND